jgi:CNT family concentrative nucleoside transporter
MACPASLAVSKLLYPETEDQSKDQEKLTAEDEEKEKKCINFIEAAAKGAVDAAPVILNIAAVMIAFVSLIALVNFFLRSAGDLVGVCLIRTLPSLFFKGASLPWLRSPAFPFRKSFSICCIPSALLLGSPRSTALQLQRCWA